MSAAEPLRAPDPSAELQVAATLLLEARDEGYARGAFDGLAGGLACGFLAGVALGLYLASFAAIDRWGETVLRGMLP